MRLSVGFFKVWEQFCPGGVLSLLVNVKSAPNILHLSPGPHEAGGERGLQDRRSGREAPEGVQQAPTPGLQGAKCTQRPHGVRPKCHQLCSGHRMMLPPRHSLSPGDGARYGSCVLWAPRARREGRSSPTRTRSGQAPTKGWVLPGGHPNRTLIWEGRERSFLFFSFLTKMLLILHLLILSVLLVKGEEVAGMPVGEPCPQEAT